METIVVRVARTGGVEVPLPSYQTPGSAGMDLHAALEEPLIVSVFERRLIPTGLAIALPNGYEAQIRPRSGLALRHGIGVLNSPGTIDADYRGELKVLVINLGSEPFTVRPLERIAQMVIQPVVRASLVWALELEPTERGAGGYGSTGRE